MDIIRGIENVKLGKTALSLALGNFDGVHLGHQRLIKELVNKARDNNAKAAAFIFDPHPARVINPEQAPRLLTSSEKKAELFAKLGLDLLIYNKFSPEIQRWSPEEFVKRILVQSLNVNNIFIGFNYSFGYRGAGTPDMLRKMGKDYSFEVNIIPPVEVDGEIVSSSLIRKCMQNGDIKKAAQLLAYNPCLQGTVVRGEQRGRTIGFPTANLEYDTGIIIPAPGVYAAEVISKGCLYCGVVNIGRKPTFHDDYPVTIEVHLLDYNGDDELYGEKMEIIFLSKIRDEQKFAGVAFLIQQINKDIAITRSLCAGKQRG